MPFELLGGPSERHPLQRPYANQAARVASSSTSPFHRRRLDPASLSSSSLRPAGVASQTPQAPHRHTGGVPWSSSHPLTPREDSSPLPRCTAPSLPLAARPPRSRPPTAGPTASFAQLCLPHRPGFISLLPRLAVARPPILVNAAPSASPGQSADRKALPLRAPTSCAGSVPHSVPPPPHCHFHLVPVPLRLPHVSSLSTFKATSGGPPSSPPPSAVRGATLLLPSTRFSFCSAIHCSHCHPPRAGALTTSDPSPSLHPTVESGPNRQHFAYCNRPPPPPSVATVALASLEASPQRAPTSCASSAPHSARSNPSGWGPLPRQQGGSAFATPPRLLPAPSHPTLTIAHVDSSARCASTPVAVSPAPSTPEPSGCRGPPSSPVGFPEWPLPTPLGPLGATPAQLSLFTRAFQASLVAPITSTLLPLSWLHSHACSIREL